MDLPFTEEDIWNATELYIYDKGILYIVDGKGNAYGFCQGSKRWFSKKNFEDYFDSSLMLTYLSIPTKEEAVQLYRSWKQ